MGNVMLPSGLSSLPLWLLVKPDLRTAFRIRFTDGNGPVQVQIWRAWEFLLPRDMVVLHLDEWGGLTCVVLKFVSASRP